jgi:UDP-4-keto-D-QuiNAc 4-reductase
MILVTGGTGFLGHALCLRLANQYPLRITVRNTVNNELLPNTEAHLASLAVDQDWSCILSGVSVLVHCAARVHIMKDKSSDPLADFISINVDGTLNLARQAAKSGIKRFIFISSIKVNGEETMMGRPFTADQDAKPIDPYGISKFEAEEGLRSLAVETSMEVVIIRPPLIYGPGVKANFLSMIEWLMRGVPLPLGSIVDNRRSFVYIDNLVDLIVCCVDHPAAANQTFLVSDDNDMSTAGLLSAIGIAMDQSIRLLRFPVKWIQVISRLIGKPGISQRLCSSLQVDIQKTKELLGWTPPVKVEDGLRRTVKPLLDKKAIKLS